MPICPFCSQEINEVHFTGTQIHEGIITLDDKCNAEFDDDENLTEEEAEVKCPKCGNVIISYLLGPYDPRIEAFLRGDGSKLFRK
jgi:DNA-directed RNA polymerase subunit M/transcription elongation factor TFIIS